MTTLAQRLEQLRTKRGVSRPAMAAMLGVPRLTIEKFESGRQTPTQEQMQKIARYFNVSEAYLRGETRGEADWMMDEILPPSAQEVLKKTAAKEAAKEVAAQVSGGGENLADAFMKSAGFQDALRQAVLDVLRSPEGKELLAKAVSRAR